MDDKLEDLKENLKKFERWGIRIIKDRYENPKNEDLGTALQGQIINVFNNLFEFDPKYIKTNFDTKILKKKFSSIPSKEKIVKLIYEFLCDNKVEDKKQVEKSYKNIENQIKKLRKNPGLPFPKEYLIKKLKRLKRAKIQYLLKYQQKNQQAFTDGLNKLASLGELKLTNAEHKNTINDILKYFEYENEANLKFQHVQDKIVDVCKILSDECKSIKVEEERQSLHDFIKNVTRRLEIILAQIDWKNSGDDTNCQRYLKELKSFVRQTRSSKKKFAKNEQKREKRAYSIESMERIIKVHNDIIARANGILKENGIAEINLDNLSTLKKYEEMADSRDPKLLEKNYFDSAVKEIQSTVESEINKSRRKSMFKTKAPSSNQVLREILKLF